MFATLINNIPTNAMRKLAFIHAGIFYVRRHSSTTLYRCPSTPVYWLNGHTAFVGECDKQRDRLGHLLFLLCYNTPTLPTPHCLAATERRPTKRAHRLLSTRTPCGSTLRRAAATAARRTQPTCATSSAANSSACVPTYAASACATRARCSLSPSICREASASADRLTTSVICAPWPSRHWPDTGIATHRPPLPAACFVRRQAGRRTPLREHFILSNQLNLL